MALDKEQIKGLLGTGLSNEVVATAVGCDPSYITQLMSDETFSGEVISLRAAALTANSKRDRKADGIEDKLLLRLEEAVDNNLIYKPNDILRATAIVNNMKRRGVPANESLNLNNRIVNLTIPVRIQQQFITNANGEVVEVAGKTLVTMNSQTLLKELAETSGSTDGKSKFEQVGRYLPSAAAVTAESIRKTG